mgnify:CR=1 FL=1
MHALRMLFVMLTTQTWDEAGFGSRNALSLHVSFLHNIICYQEEKLTVLKVLLCICSIPVLHGGFLAGIKLRGWTQ